MCTKLACGMLSVFSGWQQRTMVAGGKESGLVGNHVADYMKSREAINQCKVINRRHGTNFLLVYFYKAMRNKG
jgi:hypothetical protein